MRQATRVEGFTLLEVLLSAVVALVVLSALLLLLHSVTSVRESQEGLRGSEALRAVQTEMAYELRHVAPGESNACELAMSPGHLSFCTFLPIGPEGWPVHTAVAYALLDSGELEHVHEPRGGTAVTNTILENVATFSVQSSSEETGKEGSPAKTPALVQVLLALESGERSENTVFIPSSLTVRSTLERR